MIRDTEKPDNPSDDIFLTKTLTSFTSSILSNVSWQFYIILLSYGRADIGFFSFLIQEQVHEKKS